MSASLLPEGLWELIQPLLPLAPNRPKGGSPRLLDRACLTGTLFMLRSGIAFTTTHFLGLCCGTNQ